MNTPLHYPGKRTTQFLQRSLLAFAKEMIYGRNGPSTGFILRPPPHKPLAHFGNVPNHFLSKYARVLCHLWRSVKKVKIYATGKLSLVGESNCCGGRPKSSWRLMEVSFGPRLGARALERLSLAEMDEPGLSNR